MDYKEYKNRLISFDYETQYFGIHPRSFIDIVYNQFCENMISCLDSFKTQLMQEHNGTLPPGCIHKLTDELLQTLTAKIDKFIDKLELYVLDNIMCIDPQVVLPEDKNHIMTPCTKEEDENIDREIEELKRKILEEKARRKNLKQTISRQNQVMTKLTLLHKQLEQLLNTATGVGMTEENIQTLYSNLEKLVRLAATQEEK